MRGDTFSKFQSDEEFRFSIKILDIKNYVAQNQVAGVYIPDLLLWITIKLDMERKIVTSATIDGLCNDNSG